MNEFNNDIISHHIFIFPFSIQYTGKDFFEKISASIQKNKKEDGDFLWTNKAFDFENGSNHSVNNLKYSEYHYFHPFVRDTLFYGSKNEAGNDFPVMKYYDCNLGGKAKFKILLKETERLLTLSVQNISLRIFETRVGMLSLELVNKRSEHGIDDIESINLINDVGRRIYPQFLGAENGIIDTKSANSLAHKIELAFEGFSSSDTFESEKEEGPTAGIKYRKKSPVVADYIQKLLGTPFVRDPLEYDAKNNKNFYYTPVIDDRMFVVCWYGSDLWSRKSVTAGKAGGLIVNRSKRS